MRLLHFKVLSKSNTSIHYYHTLPTDHKFHSNLMSLHYPQHPFWTKTFYTKVSQLAFNSLKTSFQAQASTSRPSKVGDAGGGWEQTSTRRICVAARLFRGQTTGGLDRLLGRLMLRFWLLGNGRFLLNLVEYCGTICFGPNLALERWWRNLFLELCHLSSFNNIQVRYLHLVWELASFFTLVICTCNCKNRERTAWLSLVEVKWVFKASIQTQYTICWVNF